LELCGREATPAQPTCRDTRGMAPIMGIVKAGWAATTHQRLERQRLARGAHGFDPLDRSMAALFVAAGPGVPAGITVPPSENVNIYNFLCAVLRLQPAKNDGTGALAQSLLPSERR